MSQTRTIPYRGHVLSPEDAKFNYTLYSIKILIFQELTTRLKEKMDLLETNKITVSQTNQTENNSNQKIYLDSQDANNLEALDNMYRKYLSEQNQLASKRDGHYNALSALSSKTISFKQFTAANLLGLEGNSKEQCIEILISMINDFIRQANQKKDEVMFSSVRINNTTSQENKERAKRSLHYSMAELFACEQILRILFQIGESQIRKPNNLSGFIAGIQDSYNFINNDITSVKDIEMSVFRTICNRETTTPSESSSASSASSGGGKKSKKVKSRSKKPKKSKKSKKSRK